MVTITNFKVHKNKEGNQFCSLILSGDVELVKSKETGKFYVTVRKTSITSTFDEVVCKQMIGKILRVLNLINSYSSSVICKLRVR